jgi:SPP1 gp7 family putative phage head morphogenesis protein
MLPLFRRKKSWVKYVMSFVIVALAATTLFLFVGSPTGFMSGGGAQTVADIAGQQITAKEFSRHYKRIYDTYNQMYNLNSQPPEIVQQLGIGENALNQLVSQYAVVAEAEKQVKDEMTRRLRIFFKQISSSNTKKEALNMNIFPKLSKAFVGFNTFVNKMVGDVLKKLQVQVVDDVDDTGKTTGTDTKKLIKDKTTILKKSLADQMVNTKDNILKDIKLNLSQGITAGQSVTTIKKDIEKKYNYKNGIGWKAARTTKTAISNANAVLKLTKWLNMGFTKFEWITRDDSKVRPKHAAKNHKVYDIKKALNDINNWDAYPGKSANCRCTPVLYD